eukprot:scaffold27710_cov62-Phaeocystis_antarctica.AAC.4
MAKPAGCAGMAHSVSVDQELFAVGAPTRSRRKPPAALQHTFSASGLIFIGQSVKDGHFSSSLRVACILAGHLLSSLCSNLSSLRVSLSSQCRSVSPVRRSLSSLGCCRCVTGATCGQRQRFATSRKAAA